MALQWHKALGGGEVAPPGVPTSPWGPVLKNPCFGVKNEGFQSILEKKQINRNTRRPKNEALGLENPLQQYFDFAISPRLVWVDVLGSLYLGGYLNLKDAIMQIWDIKFPKMHQIFLVMSIQFLIQMGRQHRPFEIAPRSFLFVLQEWSN